jgi:transcriptional regulator with XRE-family HTH domain
MKKSAQPYSSRESVEGRELLNFRAIQNRLLARLRERIRNGEFTERGFAKRSGISQPHIHNVLKGAKALSRETLDLVLKALNCGVLDLYSEQELRAYLQTLSAHGAPSVDLPLLAGRIGPGSRLEERAGLWETRAVPCAVVEDGSCGILARLTFDPAMQRTVQGHDLALLEMLPAPHGRLDFSQLYVVDRGPDTVLRWVRAGARGIYLVSDCNADAPQRWECVLPDGSSRARVLGRVRWLGLEIRPRKPPGRGGYGVDEAAAISA